MSQDRICVGAIAGAFGVKGDVRLKSFCAEAEAVAEYGLLWSEDGSQSFEIILNGPIKNGFSARISGVSTKEQGDALSGTRLFADRSALPSLPDDEFYHADLIGLAVFDTGGKELGRVTSVENHGAGDFLEIQGPGLKNGALLPFTHDAVPTVDLASARIITDPPDGVFPE
ncbi:ribosome maturation factor RimM [Aliiroseovarius subalbicans]|uniref:ribosome maturation factor RimM n=1 Tax=Aliiroseovarius subalbicans TaxID=2925840 RepID=UPI001F59C27C|nr:ribosome maturation factor RimM [Aliiroseovarius subalbicans]MCI2400685.1 ribosome maturation factor RimM [Aliiroseovarius subalbicans]